MDLNSITQVKLTCIQRPYLKLTIKKKKRHLDVRGTKTEGERRYSLILSKAYWQSSFQTISGFFLKSQKISSHMSINLTMKLLMYYNLPIKSLISLSVLGSKDMSSLALILSKSTYIPLLLTIYHNRFLEITPKVHFLGFNLNINFLILSKNLSKAVRWSLLSWDFIIISSTYTSISWCIISWKQGENGPIKNNSYILQLKWRNSIIISTLLIDERSHLHIL